MLRDEFVFSDGCFSVTVLYDISMSTFQSLAPRFDPLQLGHKWDCKIVVSSYSRRIGTLFLELLRYLPQIQLRKFTHPPYRNPWQGKPCLRPAFQHRSWNPPWQEGSSLRTFAQILSRGQPPSILYDGID